VFRVPVRVVVVKFRIINVKVIRVKENVYVSKSSIICE